MPTYEIAKLILFTTLTFWLGVLSLGGIVFVIRPLSLPEQFAVSSIFLRGVGVLFIMAAIGYLVIVRFRHIPLKISSWNLSLPVLPVGLAQIALGTVDLLPTNISPGYMVFLGIYLFAIVGGVISHVPGGLGLFDTIILMCLKTYISPPAVLSALMLYRIMYYLVPFSLAILLLGTQEAINRKELFKQVGSIATWSTTFIAPHILLPRILTDITLLISKNKKKLSDS